MRLPVTLSLALIAVASLRAEAPPVQGTMPEDYIPTLKPLLVAAVERSPNTISASLALAQAEAAKMSAYSVLYPSLSLSADYQRSTESVSSTASQTSSGLFYSAGLSQPIFEWGAYKNGALIGSLGLKISQKQYAEAYRLLAISIREQYMALIDKKIQKRNAAFNLKLSQESLAAQNARFEAGASSQAELSNFRMSVEEAKLAADRSDEEYAYAKRVLTRLVGIDDIDDASVPLMVPHPEYQAPKADAILSGFVGNGIESTFQSQVYQLQVKQQDLNYQIQRVRLLPKVNASAGYSYENYTAASVGNVQQVGIAAESYSVAASWSIFDGFATRAAKLSALETKRSVELQKKTYVDTTIDSITYMRHQIDFSSRAMSLAEVHHALIEAEVKRIGEDLGLGYASQASVDSGKLNLYSTEYAMAYARNDFLNHWTEFISLAGIDPALDNIPSRYVR